VYKYFTPTANSFRFPFDAFSRLTLLDLQLFRLLSSLTKISVRRYHAAACWPSLRFLAETLNSSERSISRSIYKLKNHSMITVEQRRARGVFRSNVFKVKGWATWRLTQFMNSFQKIFAHRPPNLADIVKDNKKISLSDQKTFFSLHKNTEKRVYKPLRERPSGTLRKEGSKILEKWKLRGAEDVN
jgi:DNA-binding transcriptional regulator YhcF (GntR family)